MVVYILSLMTGALYCNVFPDNPCFGVSIKKWLIEECLEKKEHFAIYPPLKRSFVFIFSLPRYKTTREIKQFAFVEFEKENEAEAAIKVIIQMKLFNGTCFAHLHH